MSRRDKPRCIDSAATIGRIQAAHSIVLTTHARADGDAVGCVTALRRILRQQDLEAQAYLHEPVLERYGFLPDTERVRIWNVAQAAEVLSGADLLIVVDTCSNAQLGDVAEAIRAASLFKIAIDHHVTRDPIVDEILLDERAGACAQIITRLCDAAGWPIDAESAALLYCGLATDTGWFRFPNADAAAYATAARLVEAGARPNELYEHIYLNDAEPRVRLIGDVLSSFELLADGRLAVMRITREMLKRCGATSEMTEDIINEPQRIGSVIACVLLVEPSGDGPVRVSFRSKRGVDVAGIAQQFGGGGHARAAGARLKGTLEEAYQQIVPVLVRAIEEMEQTNT